MWFLKSAKLGFAPAQNDIGLIYLHGLGIPANKEKGLEWLVKAAAQGHVESQRRLSEIFEAAKKKPGNAPRVRKSKARNTKTAVNKMRASLRRDPHLLLLSAFRDDDVTAKEAVSLARQNYKWTEPQTSAVANTFRQLAKINADAVIEQRNRLLGDWVRTNKELEWDPSRRLHLSTGPICEELRWSFYKDATYELYYWKKGIPYEGGEPSAAVKTLRMWEELQEGRFYDWSRTRDEMKTLRGIWFINGPKSILTLFSSDSSNKGFKKLRLKLRGDRALTGDRPDGGSIPIGAELIHQDYLD